jgi:hypothetical protein
LPREHNKEILSPAGESLPSFLLEIDSGGSVTSPSFGDGSREWVAWALAARRPGNPHLFYDPLSGGMEYVWLSWEGIEQHVMERLVGQQFEEADFLPAPVFARRTRALDPEGRFPPS